MKTNIVVTGFLGMIVLLLLGAASVAAILFPLFVEGGWLSVVVGIVGLGVYHLLHKEFGHWWRSHKT